MKLLYDNEGITSELFNVFLVYRAGTNRPVHELLAPRRRFQESRINSEFEGMVVEPVSRNALIAVPSRLLSDIRSQLTGDVAKFLLSLHDADPKFDLIGLQHVAALPAIKWKVHNLERLKFENPEKHAQQRDKLMSLFH